MQATFPFPVNTVSSTTHNQLNKQPVLEQILQRQDGKAICICSLINYTRGPPRVLDKRKIHWQWDIFKQILVNIM